MVHADDLDQLPGSWIDPLDLYGDFISDLKAAGCSLDKERYSVKELVEEYGASWVWDNRRRLVQVAKVLKDYPRK